MKGKIHLGRKPRDRDEEPDTTLAELRRELSCQGQQVEGESDNLFYWSLEFIECHEAGI